MGLGNMDLFDDGDGDGGKETLMTVLCSICLDAVRDEGDRSWAKLQCGHQFHLDCIGSAFNVKGAMQCPNCRKIEKGHWLYANGSRPLPEFSMDEWAHDEDLYDISYSEMSFGVHWCPFSGSMTTRLPSTFDEGEYSSSSYHDLIGPHAVFAEHTPVSSTSHPCPYVAYIGPIHPSSSTSSGSISDGSSFNNHWNGTSEIPSSYVFPSMDVPPYHHNWDHSWFARVGGAEQPSIPSVTQRTSRNVSDMPRPGMHPYIFGHSTVGRAPSSLTSQMVPPYPGTLARPRDRNPSLQSYFQQSNSNPTPTRGPVIPSSRRSSNHRGLPQVASISSSLSSDQSNGFYLFSSSSSSGRNHQEVENHPHVWEREHQQQPPFPLSQVDRDSSIWGPFHLPGGGSDNLMRSNNNNYNRQRHGGSERMPSHQQNRS